MPRAKPYPDDGGSGAGDEEEKTTIESGWEDEASTTVEQGQLDNKIRNELGLELPTPPRAQQQQSTGITQTGAVDEPTVDDQHVPQLSTITPLRQDQNARLSITQGNDTGQSFEIIPGKTYTIGRAIDNDVVLTDIAVSRKHFDLRFEDGSWIIVDRGSGNGTVVNGNVEDNPFMLASGDVIEIGNTVFRFEQEKSTAIGHGRQHVEPLEDEEELSTVAGKPMRAEVIEVAEAPQAPRARSDRPVHDRPKTLPPPLPLRSAPVTQPPPLNLPPQPMSTMPPLGSRPQMLGEPMPQMNPMAMPTGSQPRPTAYPTYPQATDIPPHSVHAQMLLIQTQNRRGDGSTMHVPPTPYDGMVATPNVRWSPPQLTKRAKLIFAGAGIAALAAIATIAIVSSDDKPKPTAKNAATVEPIKQPEPVAKIETPAPPPPVQTVKPEAQKIETPVIKVEPKKPEVAKIVEAPPPPKKPEQKTEQKTEPKVEPKKIEPKIERPEKKVEPKKIVESPPPKKTEPKVEPKRVAMADSSSAKSKAESLYRAKKFNDASATLVSASKSASDDEARELKKLAEYYSGLGKAMNAGMAPGTDAIVAFENLRRASNYDKNVGGFYDSDIQSKLAQVAPKAAFSYYAKKNYQAARVAVIAAEQYGNSEGVAIVRQKLESVARDLYNEAQGDSFQSASSKDKLKQIKLIVDSKSPWYQKANKALGT